MQDFLVMTSNEFDTPSKQRHQRQGQETQLKVSNSSVSDLTETHVRRGSIILSQPPPIPREEK